MHILITADPVSLQMIWDYCQDKKLTMYYGRIDHDVHEIAWQIEHESCSHLDILLLLFPSELRVLSGASRQQS
jgi:hypothetical protein